MENTGQDSHVIEMKNVLKTYHMDGGEVHALRKTSFIVSSGDFVAIMGASGSGKSTLMNIIGCLTRPDGGEFMLDGVDTRRLGRKELSEIRNTKIGFVFQGFNLLPRTSALENVELPLLYNRRKRVADPEHVALDALERVGLKDRAHHDPNQLSGGQQQRVAIARALVNNPALILADEPTGNLDSHTAIEVMALFQELNGQGITVVLVTHENDIAQYAKRVIRLRDGRIIADERAVGTRCAREDAMACAPVDDDMAGEES